jgi:DNA processing protein
MRRATLDPASPVALSGWLRGVVDRRLPAQVWVRGQAAAALGERVAIVGARAAARGSLDYARVLAEKLAAGGRVIVSGGALGVDGAAHEGALAAGGRTLVVLGTGVDVAYPERHAPLFARVVDAGALLSPFPPGTTPKRGHFPKRNPIIAALADAVVIVEAGVRSGSLGTAAAARRLHRPLWARPGSAGCDALLARGEARPAPDAAALADALLGRATLAPTLDEYQAALHTALLTTTHAEALAQRLGRPLADVLADLCELELLRRAIRLEDGRYLALPGAGDLKE